MRSFLAPAIGLLLPLLTAATAVAQAPAKPATPPPAPPAAAHTASHTSPGAVSVRVELNNIETADNRCRLTFVIENKDKEAMQSLKLDLAVFNPQGIVQRRLVTEMGPLRGSKTIVKTFAVDGACGEIGSILVNDATCAPGTPDTCLTGLTLASRVKDVKLYK